MNQLTDEMMDIFSAIGALYVQTSKKHRLETIKELNKLVTKEGMVFIGDSITEQFPIYEMYQGATPVYNRGVGGDTTPELLGKLQEVVFDLEPKKIYMLIGINDLGAAKYDLEDIMRRIVLISDRIKERLPNSELFILSVYPVNPTVQSAVMVPHKNEDVIKINKMIAEQYDMEKWTYIDIFHHLVDETGNLKIDYTTDGIHLSIHGYKAVMNVLNQYLYD